MNVLAQYDRQAPVWVSQMLRKFGSNPYGLAHLEPCRLSLAFHMEEERCRSSIPDREKTDPISQRDWAEMIADRLGKDGDEGTIEVLKLSLDEYYYFIVNDVKESILTGTPNEYVKAVMEWAMRESLKEHKA